MDLMCFEREFWKEREISATSIPRVSQGLFFPELRLFEASGWPLFPICCSESQTSSSCGPRTPLPSRCILRGASGAPGRFCGSQTVLGSDSTFRDVFHWKSSLFTHLSDFKLLSDVSAPFFTTHGIELVGDWSFLGTEVQILVCSFLMNILEVFLSEYLRDLYPLAAFHKSAAHFSHLEIPAVKELGFFSSVACLCYKCLSFALN